MKRKSGVSRIEFDGLATWKKRVCKERAVRQALQDEAKVRIVRNFCAKAQIVLAL